MKAIKQFASSLVLLSLLLLSHTMPAHAAGYDFTVNDFNADYTLSNTQKHGEMKVVEVIDLTYLYEHHGILRAIPNSYKKHTLNIHDVTVTSTSGAPTQFTASKQNGNTVFKIGDPARTITGRQNYKISYTVDNVIGFYPDHDELYWDINGDQWNEDFTHVSATIHLPAGLKHSGNQPLCYSGGYGSTSQDCTVTTNGQTIAAETKNGLASDQTLSIVAGFQKGYFAPFTFADWVQQYAPKIIATLILPAVAFIICFQRWRSFGRDERGRGVIIAYYDVPNGLKPIEVGTLLDFKTDNKDISATIIDLAVRHYIKIIETRKDKLIGKDDLSYSLELVNNDMAGLSAVESQLLSSLFGQLTVGEQINLKTKANALYTAAQVARSATTSGLTTAGYFKRDPSKVNSKLLTVVIIGLMVLTFIGSALGPVPLISIILTLGIMFGFSRIMPARTKLGVETLEHIKGLKLFLQVTEAERFKKLQGPNAAYAASPEPVKTVDLFEKLLPYAMVLGVEKEWAGQFANLYSQPPSWYGGNLSTFSTLYLLNNLNSGFAGAVNTAFSAPRSSGSSGFSGGGFSGGGGGGGGGGW
ncbi:MAG: hypothetical protein JWO41_540 [Candidatus Saccharibacteria bacterium]|nr:hypothetical protein [Candidatus Saccharibacteria bacterium]